MALSEFEIKKCERELEAFMAMRRPPVQIRPQLDLGYRVENQSIEIFEIRPQWQNPSETMELPVAKTSYVKAKNCWKVYWQRADLKWHAYGPKPKVKRLSEFLELVKEDRYACFFG